MSKQFYEAAVLAEHYARRYPQGGLAAKSTEIGMQSWADAYSSHSEIDRASDLKRLIDLALYTAETWPDKEQGDAARINLGQIYLGMGRYDDAIKVLGTVRRRSRDWVTAHNRLGAAHWAKSRDLERRGDTAGAQAEAQVALEVLNAALQARREAGAGLADSGLVTNVGDVATVLTETGKPADALALLDPIVKAQPVKSGPGFTRLIETQLKAFITAGKVEPAIASMKALEQSGAAGGRTKLYVDLGKLLERELESLEHRRDKAALSRMRQSYKAFLTTLAASETGQSYDSLQWAGEGLLALDAYQDAEKVFRRVLDEFTKDPQFLQQKGGNAKLLRTRLKLAAALRGERNFEAAGSILGELLKQKPPVIETLFEKGLILEAEAEAGRGTWSAALQHWEKLARDMERMRPRSASYYDVWYHVAWVLSKRKEPAKARQTLMGVMRLSPAVGGSDMKTKYVALLDKLR
jgi:tetratricopeptide (TPR) repeat protein